jgi:hypothetical protein
VLFVVPSARVPKYIVFPEKYELLKYLVGDPISYTLSLSGIKLPTTTPDNFGLFDGAPV